MKTWWPKWLFYAIPSWRDIFSLDMLCVACQHKQQQAGSLLSAAVPVSSCIKWPIHCTIGGFIREMGQVEVRVWGRHLIDNHWGFYIDHTENNTLSETQDYLNKIYWCKSHPDPWDSDGETQRGQGQGLLKLTHIQKRARSFFVICAVYFVSVHFFFCWVLIHYVISTQYTSLL